MTMNRVRYHNVPYTIGDETVGIVQHLIGVPGFRHYLVRGDDKQLKSATEDEFLAHVNAKASEAQEEYNESCCQEHTD